MPFSLAIVREKKHINISKSAGLFRDWAGGKFCLCVFSGHSLWGRKHINKIPPKIPGESREKFVYVFFLYVFFLLPWRGRPPQQKRNCLRKWCAKKARCCTMIHIRVTECIVPCWLWVFTGHPDSRQNRMYAEQEVLRSPPPSTESKTPKTRKVSKNVSREEFGTPRSRTLKKSQKSLKSQEKVRKSSISLTFRIFFDFVGVRDRWSQTLGRLFLRLSGFSGFWTL